MQMTRERLEIRLIRKWYERIAHGPKPSKTEVQLHFRGYADQAEVLIRRVESGQPWNDFVMGLDGAPAVLRRRMIKQVAGLTASHRELASWAPKQTQPDS